MAYVYLHTRKDTNNVFYVGIGSDKNKYRAKNKKARNQHWLNIIKKTNYTISIIYDNLTWEEACLKEIELIKFYGRLDKNEGLLVNLTDGGEGRLGSQDVCTPIYQINLKGEIIKKWNNVPEIIKNNSNYKKVTLYACLNHKKHNITHNNFLWIYVKEYSDNLVKEKLNYINLRYNRLSDKRKGYKHTEESKKLMSLKMKERLKKGNPQKGISKPKLNKLKVKLTCQSTNKILNFNSVLECCNFLNCVTSTIYSNNNKIYKNFKIELYKEI